MKWLMVLLAIHKSNQIGKKAGFFSEEKFTSVINFLQTKISALLCIFLRLPQLNFSKNSQNSCMQEQLRQSIAPNRM